MSTKAKGRKMSINLDRAPVQDHSSSPMSSPRRRRASQVELDLARVLVMCSDVRKRSQNSDGSYAEEGSCVERARNLRHQAENCVQRLRALMGLGSSVKAIQASGALLLVCSSLPMCSVTLSCSAACALNEVYDLRPSTSSRRRQG